MDSLYNRDLHVKLILVFFVVVNPAVLLLLLFTPIFFCRSLQNLIKTHSAGCKFNLKNLILLIVM